MGCSSVGTLVGPSGALKQPDTDQQEHQSEQEQDVVWGHTPVPLGMMIWKNCIQAYLSSMGSVNGLASQLELSPTKSRSTRRR